MSNQNIFMFSGQGSQYYNMGKELYDKDSTFHKNMVKLDEIYGDINGCSVIKHMYDSNTKTGSFNNIRYTHPAIFMVEYSLAQTLIERSIYPDYLLGASLGEYSACVVANVISCEDALQCISMQVKMLENNCMPGGMIAIIADFKLYEEIPLLYKNSELASINFGSHFVVAGKEKELCDIATYLKANRIAFVKLPVQYAFHSLWIESIGEEYKKFLQTKIQKDPKFKMISCMTGALVKSIEYDYLWKVIRKPMNFINAINCLEDNTNFMYIDLGPSGTMANFTKYNTSKEKWPMIFPIMTQAHKEINNISKIHQQVL